MTTTLDVTSAAAPAQHLEFPDSDGKPMGETGIHVIQSLDLLAALRWYFRKRTDVYVGANMFIYFDPTDPTMNFCPDVFVILGAKPGGERRSWKTWEEGKAPDVIIEITSKSTRRVDTFEKKALYEELGVREYFLFDPLNEYLRPPLQGYRYAAGKVLHLTGDVLRSDMLAVELRVKDDGLLHLFDPRTSQWLWTPAELGEHAEEEAARAEGERARAEEEAAHAEEERARAEEERARAEAAEAENARLREELTRLRGERK